MRSIWFALICPTVDEVKTVLRTQFEERGGYDFVGPASDSVLFISVKDHAALGQLDLEDEYAELLAALNGATPTVQVWADVSGRVPGDEQVKALAELLLGAFTGFAFDDYFSYDHAWTLAEIRNDTRVDGLHFFDYRGSYERYKATQW